MHSPRITRFYLCVCVCVCARAHMLTLCFLWTFVYSNSASVKRLIKRHIWMKPEVFLRVSVTCRCRHVCARSETLDMHRCQTGSSQHKDLSTVSHTGSSPTPTHTQRACHCAVTLTTGIRKWPQGHILMKLSNPNQADDITEKNVPL